MKTSERNQPPCVTDAASGTSSTQHTRVTPAQIAVAQSRSREKRRRGSVCAPAPCRRLRIDHRGLPGREGPTMAADFQTQLWAQRWPAQKCCASGRATGSSIVTPATSCNIRYDIRPVEAPPRAGCPHDGRATASLPCGSLSTAHTFLPALKKTTPSVSTHIKLCEVSGTGSSSRWLARFAKATRVLRLIRRTQPAQPALADTGKTGN